MNNNIDFNNVLDFIGDLSNSGLFQKNNQSDYEKQYYQLLQQQNQQAGIDSSTLMNVGVVLLGVFVAKEIFGRRGSSSTPQVN